MIKNSNEIKLMREAGKIVELVHQEVRKRAIPGVKLSELNHFAHDLIKKANAIPVFLGYDGFPGVICTSLNNALVHGVPSERILKDGDILSLDVAVKYKGYIADAATTFGIGLISFEAKELITAGKLVLNKAVNLCKEGISLGELGNFIYNEAKRLGYNVSKIYAGHFIGKEMHEDPIVLNYGIKGKGLILKEGMTLCVEPILFKGKERLMIDPIDGWTVYLKSGNKATHEEYTILVGKEKGEILTKI